MVPKHALKIYEKGKRYCIKKMEESSQTAAAGNDAPAPKRQKVSDMNKDGENNEKNTENNLSKVTRESTWDGDIFIYGGGKVNVHIKQRLTTVRVAYWVAEIDDDAFNRCQNLTDINIPSQVERIGNASFKDCEKLRHVTFSEHSSLYVIGDEAFEECNSLTSMILPNSVREIGYCAFHNCQQLTNVVLPKSGPRLIKEFTFSGCVQLKSMILPDTITKIDHHAFQWCGKLKVVLMSDSVEEIGEDAFSGCEQLHSIHRTNPQQTRQEQLSMVNSILDSPAAKGTIELPRSLRQIWKYAFVKCHATISVKVPDSVTYIGYGAFRHCRQLQHVHLPTTLQELSGCIFEDSALERITLPTSLLRIGDYAFYDCKKLQHVIFPEGLKRLGNGAFSGCVALSGRIEIPDSVYYFGERAFENCTQIELVTISNSITMIQRRTFRNCTGLRSVIIPDSVTCIEYDAFRFCSSLTSIDLPARLDHFGEYAFFGCDRLSNTQINTDAIHYRCDLNRGGRKFLMRSDNDDNKAYPSSLWPLILYRIMNKRDSHFCTRAIRELTTTAGSSGYTHSKDTRRASIVYFLLINGVAMEH